MDEILLNLVENLATPILFLIVAISIYTLGKGADILVEEAVTLSVRWKVPKVVIGATIVSLGTTLPEATVSVMAAINGNPDLALGNAVGSIICDTGLILGLAAILSPLPLDKNMTKRQGSIQFFSGVLLIVASLPWSHLSDFGMKNGHLSRIWGFIFLGLLFTYLYRTIKWSKSEKSSEEEIEVDESSNALVLLKIFGGIALVILSSKFLIPTVETIAMRMGIPQSIIAATLVAFGTSLPELVTAITAVKRGHGELAIGNVIGADILNVLFVVGAAASVTPGGLNVPIYFYKLQFPVMLLILGLFKIYTIFSKKEIKRWQGAILLGFYIAYTVYSYVGINY